MPEPYRTIALTWLAVSVVVVPCWVLWNLMGGDWYPFNDPTQREDDGAR